MVLRVEMPLTYAPERRYAAEVLFSEYLGLPCSIVHSDRQDTLVSVIGASGHLLLKDGLFSMAESRWLSAGSVPAAPVGTVDSTDLGSTDLNDVSPLPVLFDGRTRSERSWIEWEASRCTLRFDPLGAVFFLLSRYEEAALTQARDLHDRFPAESDTLFRSGCIERPIVDEICEMVWRCLQRMWPALRRRIRQFRLILTHDVDIPFQHAFTSAPRLLLSCGADWIRRREPLGPFRRIYGWTRTRLGDRTADPANTFGLIMDLSERVGVVSEFNFIVCHTVPRYDALYPFEHPWIADLMREIHSRGHRIGLHASYGSYLDGSQIAREFTTLREACERLGIDQPSWGGRHHWLRFRVPDTFRHWDDAGLDYDASLAYEQCIGFRGGTCSAYPTFDLARRRRLRLIERPTAIMDASLTDPGTMNLGFGEDAARAVTRVLGHCRRVRGDCVVLWHNSRLIRPAEVALYERVISS